jgi:two-component system sensor histidine kinase KdpD
LPGPRTTLGVLAVQAENRRRVLLPEQRHLLETFAGQIALAIERIQLAHEAEASRIAAETESLRNTLLASISHDLRTPLAVISGAGSTLADPAATLDPDSRRRLAQSIESRARDMSDLISNVLDLTRLESAALVLRRDWQTIDDLIGAALERCAARLRDHPVALSLPEDLPAVHVDATLIVQLFANLLENAAKYTPPGTRVSISARAEEGQLRMVVEDDGPGLPAGDPDRLFDKFQRGRSESEVTGAGLGLAICRAIARAHGGDIHAANRAEGGARFEVTLPIEEPAE